MCVIERNTDQGSRTVPTPKEVQNISVKKIMKYTHKVCQQEDNSSGSENKATILAMSGPAPKPWNPPPGLKCPCPLTNHKHEISMCAEFFNFSPLDCWEKIEKGRMCYSCFKPSSACKARKCNNVAGIPEILKCAVCASWV